MDYSRTNIKRILFVIKQNSSLTRKRHPKIYEKNTIHHFYRNNQPLESVYLISESKSASVSLDGIRDRGVTNDGNKLHQIKATKN